MCNLSEGIRDNAVRDTVQDIAMNMYRNKFSIDQIAIATKQSTEEVQAIIKKRELAMA